jgi:hypothetical protein
MAKEKENDGRLQPVVARIWLGTVPAGDSGIDWLADAYKRGDFVYSRGQRERGANTGYDHWQLVVYFGKPCRLSAVKKTFPNGHWEPTKSAAADDYVWKDDTAVADSRFEFGKKPFNRSRATDWDQVVADAKTGQLDNVPSDILVRCYGNLRRIAADHLSPVGFERVCVVYWGATGTGKSRKAWDEAGMDAYPKDPRTKFWDGYRNHRNVVIDEFRGGIDIGHLLRWLDRYPVVVEVKGSAVVLKAEKIWITSNLDPRLWYPDLDEETKSALLRRLTITHFPKIKSS